MSEAIRRVQIWLAAERQAGQLVVDFKDEWVAELLRAANGLGNVVELRQPVTSLIEDARAISRLDIPTYDPNRNMILDPSEAGIIRAHPSAVRTDQGSCCGSGHCSRARENRRGRRND